MKGPSYRDRDYAFGQAILTLRITITGIRGVTEAQLTTLRALGAIEVGPG